MSRNLLHGSYYELVFVPMYVLTWANQHAIIL